MPTGRASWCIYSRNQGVAQAVTQFPEIQIQLRVAVDTCAAPYSHYRSLSPDCQRSVVLRQYPVRSPGEEIPGSAGLILGMRRTRAPNMLLVHRHLQPRYG